MTRAGASGRGGVGVGWGGVGASRECAPRMVSAEGCAAREAGSARGRGEPIYDRATRWRDEVDDRLEWQRALATEATFAECTFQPNAHVHAAGGALSRAPEDPAAAGERLHAAARASAAARAAEREHAAAERLRVERASCTFSPDLGCSAATYRTVHSRSTPRRRPVHAPAGVSRATLEAFEDAIFAEFGECTFKPTLVAKRIPRRRSRSTDAGEQTRTSGGPGGAAGATHEPSRRPPAQPAAGASVRRRTREEGDGANERNDRSLAFLQRQEKLLQRRREGVERRRREEDNRREACSARMNGTSRRILSASGSPAGFFERLAAEDRRRARSAARHKAREAEEMTFAPAINAVSKRLPRRTADDMATAEATRRRQRLERMRKDARADERRRAPFKPSLVAKGGTSSDEPQLLKKMPQRPASAPASRAVPTDASTALPSAVAASGTDAAAPPELLRAATEDAAAAEAPPAPSASRSTAAKPPAEARWWETTSESDSAGASSGSDSEW